MLKNKAYFWTIFEITERTRTQPLEENAEKKEIVTTEELLEEQTPTDTKQESLEEETCGVVKSKEKENNEQEKSGNVIDYRIF